MSLAMANEGQPAGDNAEEEKKDDEAVANDQAN